MTEESYPLHWPVGVARTRATYRRTANFSRQREIQSTAPGGGSWRRKESLTIAAALARLNEEIRLAGATRVVISTNLRTRLDGLPASGQREPEDPGVAVYFELERERRCIPSDKWDRVADNIAGIAAAIGALRGLERWVNDANVRAAFRGFAALPDPNRVDWRAMFGIKNGSATVEDVSATYRRLAAERHPDRGGSDQAMAELNRARDAAFAELGTRKEVPMPPR